MSYTPRAHESSTEGLAAALGVTPQHISAIEHKRTASLAALLKLAEELGVTLEYLAAGKEAIRADKKLSLETKRALITLVRQLYG